MRDAPASDRYSITRQYVSMSYAQTAISTGRSSMMQVLDSQRVPFRSEIHAFYGIAQLPLRPLDVPLRRVEVLVPQNLGQRHEIISIVG